MGVGTMEILYPKPAPHSYSDVSYAVKAPPESDIREKQNVGLDFYLVGYNAEICGILDKKNALIEPTADFRMLW